MNFMQSDDLTTIASLFSQKANDYFTQKIHDYLTKVRKKTLRLLLCDYQRTARYYTIYRTFKRWLSDDFATIPRLSAGRSYDYCSPLLDIGRKPEKRCGDKPPAVPRRRAVPLPLDCPAGLAWPAMCCTVWHGSITGRTLIYLIIIGRLR